MLKAALSERMNEEANRYQFSIPAYQKLRFPVDIYSIPALYPLSMNYDCLIIPGGDDINPRYFQSVPSFSATHLVPEVIDTMDFRWAKGILKATQAYFRNLSRLSSSGSLTPWKT